LKYDFNQIIDRKGTSSSKWDLNQRLFGREDVLDMWVADMDFPCPQPVVDAIKERADHPVFGYTFAPASLYEAIIDWVGRHYNWQIEKEWIVFNAGVVNGLYSAVKAFIHPGDEVIVQPPVYYPFYAAVRNNGGQVLHNHLHYDGSRYTMDLDALRDMFRPVHTFPARMPKIKMLIHCSPHNPVGRVWTGSELKALAETCLENDCMLVSDEIHCDLLSPEAEHVVTATLSDEIRNNTITFMSASKTFNLAGLATSFVIIANDEWRRQYINARAGANSGSIFGFVATEAALRYGDDYLMQLREYIAANRAYFLDYVAQHMPELRVVDSEGTYLAWVDMRGLGMDEYQLQDFIRNEARLALDDGYAFGPGGEGFQRFNLACPREIVIEALGRLDEALKGWRR